MERPLILVTNDDGVTAPGIRALIEIAKEFGEVYVVAPDSPQSGMGHAVTINSTLFCDEIEVDEEVKEYACSGTPVDCVKLAVSQILPRKPDLCISGINHGSNSSVNVIYSGTMSAAVEAGIEGIPAIGFSLCDFAYNADFKAGEKFIKTIISQVLEHDLPKGVVLNVNIPKLKEHEIKGIKVCRQADAKWEEKFDKREDPRGRIYYWMSGEFKNLDKGDDTDEKALEEGYISVVPVRYDLTAHHFLPDLRNWDL
ncbi:5'/3'-nucleotidase SurE [Empedobacter brevis]|uniref:5'-nucleotidase SurE n=1 Tax=Empedobacter brevis NBRC 14943 = ATCC 43319 TaxID=1218108 RepID=A0A511NI75_9FLAO|nr:5'/3'-nucleotidase SurE [Empedobacter brevis]QES92629.1 5'/3'-nucleotidase SurE [Empedobacter brevis]QHC84383.1 stationary phase survival protein SurE [Empedobacter brevis]GEM52178.1 5'-nucleotidase SurE [Empedobacter brevis NBRC 14943 = ATCC 43319]